VAQKAQKLRARRRGGPSSGFGHRRASRRGLSRGRRPLMILVRQRGEYPRAATLAGHTAGHLPVWRRSSVAYSLTEPDPCQASSPIGKLLRSQASSTVPTQPAPVRQPKKKRWPALVLPRGRVGFRGSWPAANGGEPRGANKKIIKKKARTTFDQAGAGPPRAPRSRSSHRRHPMQVLRSQKFLVPRRAQNRLAQGGVNTQWHGSNRGTQASSSADCFWGSSLEEQPLVGLLDSAVGTTPFGRKSQNFQSGCLRAPTPRRAPHRRREGRCPA